MSFTFLFIYCLSHVLFTNQQQSGSKATDLTLQIDKKYKLKLEKLLQYDMLRELIPFT